MAEDLEITGATAGSPRYIVAYLDVNTNNLYDANGNLYGNSTLATTLGNEFILELHYVQDISTSDNPDNWTPWEGLSGMTVSSTLAFDDNYVHAVEATVAESTNAGSPTVKINVPEINKDVLSSSGTLVFNPFGIEPEDVQQNETRPVKQIVSYNAFEYISGTVFEFTIEDAQGLPLNVVGGENATPVRVSDPLYLFVGTDAIYENNIPDRYGEGVFKFPMNINSRKLLKALDYSGASGVSGTMEHNIYVKRNTIAGIKVGSYEVTCVRDSSQDVVATDSSDNKPYLFCCWTGSANDETVYTWWTKGNDINEDSYVYDVDVTTKIANSLHGDDDISEIVYNTDSVLFRTFAFPFIVKNLVDYGNSITIPVENTDWTKDYIISIIRNNMEIVIGKASTATYGTVMVGGSTANIDIDDGVISVKDASTSDKGVVQLVDSTSDTTSTDKAVTPNYVKVIADTKQDNLTFDTTTGIEVISGTTVKNDIATVEEVLTGATGTNIVDADNLRGALSVGQAVDVSCAPYKTGGTITYGEEGFLGGFTCSLVSGNTVGFYDTTDHKFPKYAEDDAGNPLHYLFIADVSGTGTITPNGEDAVVLSSTPKRISMEVTAKDTGYFSADTSANVVVSNWRQYEVNALTEKAKDYLASSVTNPNPDALFRSSSAYSIMNKYLIKQDMVCPFIPTIKMPDNSDLTVAAGLSYKIKYTNDNTHTITADTIPTDAYGWDTHIQMFIKGTSAINFQAPLVLMDALTPNAGHNMVVKWRNGDALVYVDDTNAGYIVVKASGTGTGTLNDAISNDYTDYVIFSGDLAGTVIDAGDATFSGGTGFSAVNILGNGTEDTVITGNIGVTSGNTINFQDLAVTGSTLSASNANAVINLTNCSLASSTLYTYTQYSIMLKLDGVIIPAGTTVYLGGDGKNKVFYDLELNGTLKALNSDIWRQRDALTQNIHGTGVIDGNYGTGMGKISVYSAGYTLNLSGITLSDCALVVSQTSSELTPSYVNLNNVNITGYTDSNLYAVGIVYLEINGGTISSDANRPVLLTNKYTYAKDLVVQTAGAQSIWLGLNATTGSKYVFENLTINKRCEFWTSGDDFITLKGVINCGAAFVDEGYQQDVKRCLYTIEPDTVLDFTGSEEAFLINAQAAKYTVFGDNITIKHNGITANIDACVFNNLKANCELAVVTSYRPAITITGSTVDPWKATNIIFTSPLDAHEASTVKLSGTTFTSVSKIASEPMRIQLPASTTVSVRGNSAPNNTDKIITAPIIVVGDNASAPSGAATVEYGVSGSTAISGLGTYIAKDGSNDFTTAITSVTASDGLGTALADANKWVKISDSLTTVETVPDVAYTGIEKHFITSNYDAIVGGTFTIPASSTVGVTLGKDANNNVQASASTVGVNGASVTIAGAISVIGTLMLTMPNHYRATFNGTINGADKGVITDSLSGGGYFQAVKGGSTINNVLLNKNLGYRAQDSLEPVTFNDCKIITLPGTTNRSYGLFITNTGCTTVLNNLINESDLNPLSQIQLGTIYFNNFINNTTRTDGNCTIDVYTGGKGIFNNCTLNGLYLRCFTGSEDAPSSLIFDGYNKNWTNRVMADLNATHSSTNVLLISGSTVDISNSYYTTPFDAAKLNGLKVGTFSDAANYSGTWTTATEETGAVTIIASGGTYHVWGEGTFINKELNPSGVDASTKGTDLYLSFVV